MTTLLSSELKPSFNISLIQILKLAGVVPVSLSSILVSIVCKESDISAVLIILVFLAISAEILILSLISTSSTF